MSAVEKKNNKKNISFILSLLFHSLVFILAVFLPKITDKNETSSVEIVVEDNSKISLEYLKNNVEPKQLVEFDKKNDDQKKDDKAKYLAAKNNSVKKEMIAQMSEQFKNVEKSKPAVEKNHWEKSIDQSAKTKLFNTGFDVYEKMRTKNIEHTHAAQENASTSADKLKNVDQSLMTQLNTREYKYYGYYTRIRHQLNQWWQPKVKEKVTKLMSKGRTIASEENKNTQVVIVLNDTGTLVKVQVLGASGVRELDDAAVEAFRQAAPFPNPPKGLIDTDGTIKIRWDFIVES